MKRRGRVRRVSKWACTVLAVVVPVVTVCSRWWGVGWGVKASDGRVWEVSIGEGLVGVGWFGPDQVFDGGWRAYDSGDWSWGWAVPTDLGGAGHAYCGFVHVEFPGVLNLFRVTLVYPVLLSSLAACLLWRSDLRARRRKRIGLCTQCGYDRRGLAADAPCPECGKKEPAPAADPPRS